MTAVAHEIRRLRDRVEELEADNKRLRTALAPDKHKIDPEWMLTPAQISLFRCLADNNVTSLERLCLLVGDTTNNLHPISNVRVQIHKMREKLNPHGFAIINVHSIGYRLVRPDDE